MRLCRRGVGRLPPLDFIRGARYYPASVSLSRGQWLVGHRHDAIYNHNISANG